jgi:hypothetical protein
VLKLYPEIPRNVSKGELLYHGDTVLILAIWVPPGYGQDQQEDVGQAGLRMRR